MSSYSLVAIRKPFLRSTRTRRQSPKHLPIVRYVPPAEFDDLRLAGQAIGFAHVESGPLVRSSYHAAESVELHAGQEDYEPIGESGQCGRAQLRL